MNNADFLHCLHLLVSLLSMCYWESEQTKLKARDMENSGHWDCNAFSWYSQKAYFTSFFTSLSWLCTCACQIRWQRQFYLPTRVFLESRGCLVLVSWEPHRPWYTAPCPEMLHFLVETECHLELQRGCESATHTDTRWGHYLPRIWALNGWVHIPKKTLPRPWPGHQFSFLFFSFPEWTNLRQLRRANFPIIVSMRGVISAPTDRVVDIVPLLCWTACLQQVVFSKSYT